MRRAVSKAFSSLTVLSVPAETFIQLPLTLFQTRQDMNNEHLIFHKCSLYGSALDSPCRMSRLLHWERRVRKPDPCGLWVLVTVFSVTFWSPGGFGELRFCRQGLSLSGWRRHRQAVGGARDRERGAGHPEGGPQRGGARPSSEVLLLSGCSAHHSLSSVASRRACGWWSRVTVLCWGLASFSRASSLMYLFLPGLVSHEDLGGISLQHTPAGRVAAS